MNIEQAKTKLASVRSSTATKHPKVLISELCAVVKFLLEELDRVKHPPVSLLQTESFEKPPTSSPQQDPLCPPQSPWPDKPERHFPGYTPPAKSPPINPPHPHRKGNAGDAE